VAELGAEIGILICGHGSKDERAFAELEQTAELIADRFVGTPVAFGFLDYVQPSIETGLDGLRDRSISTVVLAPAMLGTGNHLRNDIPQIIEAYLDRHPDMDIRMIDPIANDDELIAAAADRVRDAVAVADRELGDLAPSETVLLTVGRGASDRQANADVARLSRLLSEELDFGWAATAYAGVAVPSVEEALARVARLGLTRVIVLPYLMYSGSLLTNAYAATDAAASDHSSLQFIKAGHLSNHRRIIDSLATAISKTAGAIIDERNSHRPDNGGSDEAGSSIPDTVPGLNLPPGWKIANGQAAETAVTAVKSGAPLALTVESGDPSWLMSGGLTLDAQASVGIAVTHKTQPLALDRLVLHPPVLALGIDCPRDARAEELEITVRDICRDHELAFESIAIIVSIDRNADAPALHHLAEVLAVPLRFFDGRTLEKQVDRVTSRSEISFDELGCHNVAEAAAYSAGGPDAQLIVPQTGTNTIACAITLGPELDADAIGRPQGHLWLVGLGPGEAELRPPITADILAQVDHIVGYGPFIDSLEPLAPHQTRHDFPRNEEVQRCRKALDLAARGAPVALVAGGDPGIYETATIVWELVDGGRSRWRQISIEVVPGISAMQAAAARAGAPLGTDFCVISLSDILTPWKQIELRLAAAAAADFVVAIHNPVSRRRTKSFDRAKHILLTSRDPDTPVVVARRLGRSDEEVTVTTLGELNKGGLNASSVLLIGSNETRRVDFAGRPRVFTPRGYGPAPKSMPTNEPAPQDADPPGDPSD